MQHAQGWRNRGGSRTIRVRGKHGGADAWVQVIRPHVEVAGVQRRVYVRSGGDEPEPYGQVGQPAV